MIKSDIFDKKRFIFYICITFVLSVLLCIPQLTAHATNSKIVIVLDAGHGGSDSGAVSTHNNVQYTESYMTLVIAKTVKEELEKTGAFEVHMTRETDTRLSIPSRTLLAKNVNAQALVSLHINSAGPSATGAEVEIPNENYKPELHKQGVALGDSILTELTKLGLKNRKTVTRGSQNGNTYPDDSLADYYGIVRQSKEYNILGIIVEHAFISNSNDVNQYLSSDEKLRNLGKADAKGIMKYFHVNPPADNSTQTNNNTNNNNEQPSIAFESDDPDAYSIILGHEQRNTTTIDNSMYSIMGTSQATESQLISYFQSKASFPDYYQNNDAEVKSLNDFVRVYVQEAQAENVKVEVAFAQMIHETNWLKYGGRVKIGQYNFAGLGATDGTSDSGSFPTVRLGIRVQIQHLKAYADKNASVNTLANPLIDNRFKYVTKGSAEYVEWLGQKENPQGLGWATQVGYGNTIRNTIDKILQM